MGHSCLFSPVDPVFTSYDRSATTGLDYAINRYYDAGTRFLHVDPAKMTAVSLRVPQTLNLYVYVANDPINYIDPTGLGDGDIGPLVNVGGDTTDVGE